MENKPKRIDKIRNIVIAISLSFMCFMIFAGLVSYVRHDTNQREMQKASGNFSGYVSEIEPILQNGTTVSVSATIMVFGSDPEIVLLGSEFASLMEYTTLDLTGCIKNPKGFWEKCIVDIR